MKRLLIIAAAVAATVLALHLLSAGQVSAQTPTPIPAGNYRIVIDCNAYYAGATGLTFTLNGTPLPGATPALSLKCSPDGQARQNIQAGQSWNDFKLQYWCTTGAPAGTPTPNTLDVPPSAELDTWYASICPSTGITHPSPTPTPGGPSPTPTNTPTPGPSPTPTPKNAEVQIDLVPVGGIAETSDVDAAALGATDSGGSSGTTNAVIGGIAVGLIVLGTGGWYARRRWLS